jgi:hypothetical protein
MRKIFLTGLLFCCLVMVRAQKIVTASGIQLVSTPGIQLAIKGGIEFNENTTWKDSGTTTLLANPVSGIANWQDNTASGVLVNAKGNTIFNNTVSTQQVIGRTTFYNLQTNGAGINLQQSNEVRNNLQLEKGLVYFTNDTDSIYVSNPSLTSISSTNGFATSWVHGKLARNCTSNASSYLFPTGKIKLTDSLYAPVKLKKVNSNAAIYTVAYFPNTPADANNFLNPPIDHISQLEYWEITSNIVSGLDDDAAVSLSWRGYSAVGVNAATRDSLLVAHYINNSGFRWEPEFDLLQPNIVSGTAGSGFVTTNINVGSFTQAHKNFTLGSRSLFNRLPLEYIEWTVAAQNPGALIRWNIINDREVLKYEVERSNSGSFFNRVGTVSATGYTVSGSYSLHDDILQPGWNYYRIKVTGKNNQYFHTGIRKIYIGAEIAISIYPNPVQQNLFISFSNLPQHCSLLLYDVRGKLVHRQPVIGNKEVMRIHHLSKGLYELLLVDENGNAITTKQVVKE